MEERTTGRKEEERGLRNKRKGEGRRKGRGKTKEKGRKKKEGTKRKNGEDVRICIVAEIDKCG